MDERFIFTSEKYRSSNQKHPRDEIINTQKNLAPLRLERKMAEESSRFVSLDDSVESFIQSHENPNTVKKTERDVSLLTKFIQSKGETRNEIADIPPAELNELISEFIVCVRTKDGKDYEPSSLRGMLSSFERHLKSKSYPNSVINDLVFEKTRKTLSSKQKQLKKQGKGNKPNASVAITDDEIKILYDKGQLGLSSPEAVLNTVWLNNCLHFGLRGVEEHHNMRWGDVKLCRNDNGVEYLEFNERQTKTRTGISPRDVRLFAPKMFSTDGSERDPVAVYKSFAMKRPEKMRNPDAPFYIAVNNIKSKSLDKFWFKSNAVGVNKLGSLMKEMARKGGLNNDKIRNYSARKTMIQTLSENNVPPTQIAQLSGHKNLKSIVNYSHLSTKQQMNMSHMLTNISSTCTSITPFTQTPNTSTSIQEAAPPVMNSGQRAAMALFSNAVIHGGQFSVTINAVNQSPPLTPLYEQNAKQRKRIRIQSDSDDD